MRLLALFALVALAVSSPTTDAHSKLCRTLVDNKALLPNKTEDFITVAFPALQEFCASAGVQFMNRRSFENLVRGHISSIEELTYEHCVNKFLRRSDVPTMRRQCNDLQREQ